MQYFDVAGSEERGCEMDRLRQKLATHALPLVCSV
jgi:hypothetical protein